MSAYIREAAGSKTPFFAVAAPVAPHIAAGAKFPGNGTKLPYPVPKREYESLYLDLEVPKGANFNPANRSGVNAVWELERLGEANLGYFEEFYRRRQRALKSVDDLVGTVVRTLEEEGVLEETVIVYSSDNVGLETVPALGLLWGGFLLTWRIPSVGIPYRQPSAPGRENAMLRGRHQHSHDHPWSERSCESVLGSRDRSHRYGAYDSGARWSRFQSCMGAGRDADIFSPARSAGLLSQSRLARGFHACRVLGTGKWTPRGSSTETVLLTHAGMM